MVEWYISFFEELVFKFYRVFLVFKKLRMSMIYKIFWGRFFVWE